VERKKKVQVMWHYHCTNTNNVMMSPIMMTYLKHGGTVLEFSATHEWQLRVEIVMILY